MYSCPNQPNNQNDLQNTNDVHSEGRKSNETDKNDIHLKQNDGNSFHRIDPWLELNKITFDGADCVILSDSQLRQIKPTLLNNGKFKYIKKASIPGLTAQHINSWLLNLDSQPGIYQIVVHVSVFDCATNNKELTKTDWEELIDNLKAIFPNAQIHMSAPIPVGSRDPLYNIIYKTIDNLYYACNDTSVNFIDYFYSFITKTGAPRKQLYHNKLHPSSEGTIIIAKKLKYMLSNTKHKDCSGQQQGRNDLRDSQYDYSRDSKYNYSSPADYYTYYSDQFPEMKQNNKSKKTDRSKNYNYNQEMIVQWP